MSKKEDDATLLVQWLRDNHYNKWCPYIQIRSQFGWGQGRNFYDRMSLARRLADERDLCLTFDVLRAVTVKTNGHSVTAWLHGVELTRKDTVVIAESLPTRLRAIATQAANVGRASEHIQRHSVDKEETVLGRVVASSAKSFADVMRDYGELITLFASRRKQLPPIVLDDE
jgi:hypothetical protein